MPAAPASAERATAEPRATAPEVPAAPAGLTDAPRKARDALRMAESMCAYALGLLDSGAVPPAVVIAEVGADLARVGVVLAGMAPAPGRLSRTDQVFLLAAQGVPRPDISTALGLPARVVAGLLDGTAEAPQ